MAEGPDAGGVRLWPDSIRGDGGRSPGRPGIRPAVDQDGKVWSQRRSWRRMKMQTSEMKLDGNAIAGLLGEIFAVEMTTAHGTCASGGAVNQFGRADVYVHAPGTVVRCPSCEQVLMRIVRGRGRYWLGLSGVRGRGGAEGWGPGFFIAHCPNRVSPVRTLTH